jgi:hypothetical protein
MTGAVPLLLLGLGAAPSTASADPLAYYTVPTTDGSELWQLDLELPVGYPIAPLGLPDSAVTALAFSADGRLYAADYAAGGRLLTIDPATGAATVVGGFGLPAPQVGVFYLTGDACGRLWAAARVGVPGGEFRNVMLAVNPFNGAAIEIVELGPGIPVGGLAALGETIYALHEQALSTFDPAAGSFAPIGGTGIQLFDGFAFDAVGTLWGVTNPIVGPGTPPPAPIVHLDLETGQAQIVTFNHSRVTGLAIAPPTGACDSGPAPEIPTVAPFGLALLALALAAAAARRIAAARRPDHPVGTRCHGPVAPLQPMSRCRSDRRSRRRA